MPCIFLFYHAKLNRVSHASIGTQFFVVYREQMDSALLLLDHFLMILAAAPLRDFIPTTWGLPPTFRRVRMFTLRKRKEQWGKLLPSAEQSVSSFCLLHSCWIDFCWYVYISTVKYPSLEWKHCSLATVKPLSAVHILFVRFPWREGHCHVWLSSSTTRHAL